MNLLGQQVKVKSFQELGLHSWLVGACGALGIKRPTPVQEACIPEILAGRRVLAAAETGSGKTAAFALPILQDLSKDPYGVFAVVLTPTRELAIQIQEQFVVLGASIHVRCEVVIGGVDMMKQALALAKRPHIIIATPGRLVDHIRNKGTVELSRVRYLVMDEADRLLEQSFESHLSQILDALPEQRRTLLFSATITQSLAELKKITLADAFEYNAGAPMTTVETLREEYCFVPATVKDLYLTYMLRKSTVKSLIVFASTKSSCQILVTMLKELGEEVVGLHSDMPQRRRLASLDTFRGGRTRILVATDVASRGLDIPTVELVVNYDVPRNPVDYIHRVGRTARAGRGGLAVTLVTQYDIELVQTIEELTGKKMEENSTKESAVLELMTEVTTARRAAKLALAETEHKTLEKTTFTSKREKSASRKRAADGGSAKPAEGKRSRQDTASGSDATTKKTKQGKGGK